MSEMVSWRRYSHGSTNGPSRWFSDCSEETRIHENGWKGPSIAPKTIRRRLGFLQMGLNVLRVRKRRCGTRNTRFLTYGRLHGSNVELLVERIWDWPVAIASCGKRNYPIRGSGDLNVFPKRSRCKTNS